MNLPEYGDPRSPIHLSVHMCTVRPGSLLAARAAGDADGRLTGRAGETFATLRALRAATTARVAVQRGFSILAAPLADQS